MHQAMPGGTLSIMLRITAISAGMGGAEYLLRAAGCAEHDHARHSRDASSSGADYLLGGREHGEPAGVWAGRGLEMVGLQPGQRVTAEQMRAVYGRLEHWETGESLGRRPRRFASDEERLAAALEREPNAGEERREQIRREVKAAHRQAVGYYDATFSPVKSASVYRAALQAAGQTDLANAVSAAHDRAVREALAFIEANVTTTRVGRHATVTMDDGTRRTVGEYARIKGLVMTLWAHSSSREGDPHMHTHAAILNRVMTEDGAIYAVDGQQFKPLKGAADVIYERRFEELVTEATGARFAWRPDGKTREILGVDRVLCDESSGRRAQIQERLDVLVADYEREHGHAPGRLAMASMRREAWSHTRKAKTVESPEALAERYARKHGEEHLKDQVRTVAEAAAKVETEGLPDGQPAPMTEDELLVTAVKRTQETHATWDETALAMELNKLIGEVAWGTAAPAEITRLVGRAVAPDGPGRVVALTGRERVRVPEALREGGTAEGLPIYRASSSLRYATREQLSAERQLVAEAHLTAGPVLAADQVARVREQLTAAGLRPDQLNAVVGMLTSGKAADVLIGPAGTGKSRTVGQLDEVWREQFGAPVLGLATSQRATEVLEGDGLEALNVAMFLTKYAPKEDGSGPAEQLPPGTLIVVDEAGMADTDKLAKIADLVRGAGGKLLYTGDHEQLAAVGTGGLLRLMTKDAEPFELAQVQRFKSNEWEAEASLKFRVGDPESLAEYERHGRLRGGTKAEMGEAAVRGYMADVLAGKESVLVVKSNEDAADLSQRVRDELVSLGKVGADTLARLADRNMCGVGDLIQARKNDHHPAAENGQMVTNRELLTVVGKDDRGRLEVQRQKDGTKVWLTPEYLAEHVTLGYAGTVHAVQGRTVETGHSLIERGMARNSAYPANTRGWDANYSYCVTEAQADAHNHESYSMAATDVLREVLANDGSQVSATETYRAALESADSLAEMGGVWAMAARDAMADRHHDLLLGLLGPDRAQWLADEDGHQRLMATLQHAEMSGHDIERVLTAAITGDDRPLDDVESMSAVVRSRVQRIVEAGGDRPVPGRWTGRLQSYAGKTSEYAQELGRAMDERAAIMARAAVIAPPDWALVSLGMLPPETDMDARNLWAAKAAAVGSYREMYGVDDDQMGIGAAPSRDQDPVRHVAWHRAWEALGRPAQQADHQTLSDAQLRGQVDEWKREQGWAPEYVAHQLEQALTLAEEYRRESETRWAQAEAEAQQTGGEITDEVAALRERAERADRMRDRFANAAERYERLDQARQRWADHTAEAAERARLATEELAERGKLAEPQPEQAALFDEQGQGGTEYARAIAAEHEARAIDGELLPPDQPTRTADPEPDIIDAEVVDEQVEADQTVEAVPMSSSTEMVLDSDYGELMPTEPDASREADREARAELDIVDAEVVNEPAAAEPARTAEPAVAQHNEPEQRGDYGTTYRLDEVAEADASYPAPAQVDPDQKRLFDVDEPSAELRTSLGTVRADHDMTVQDAERRAAWTDEKIVGREEQTEHEARSRVELDDLVAKAQRLREQSATDRDAAAEDDRRRAERVQRDREEQQRRDAEALRERAQAEAEQDEPELSR
jgi:conjugative relaxase-like TrwC/TraI family protein